MVEMVSDGDGVRFAFMWDGYAHIGGFIDVYGDICVSVYVGVWDGSVCINYPGIFSGWGFGDFSRRGGTGAVSGVVGWRKFWLGAGGSAFGVLYGVFEVGGGNVVREVESVNPDWSFLEI